ncbi:efflux RND transporter periplasmic adaptor subunit [Bacillus sp. Bva_UNVM-123]|uniref:efflux RND transporter periplasmic adaptor subunit n=1 Tax=Bacillus sp. Bva_UNVM-123 TaxID=2829798 RepID=UPI00391F6EDC
MKKWVKLIIFTVSVIFVAGNLYLILKDGSKINRSAYVKEWTNITEENIKKTLHKNGIVAPEEDYHYYYDPQNGAFKQFLVKEGEDVVGGTPLYEYFSTEIESEVARVEAEKEKIENQIIALQDHIKELTLYKNSLSFAEEEKHTERSIIHSVERDIYHNELQVDMLRQEAEKYEQQLQMMSTRENKLTVISDFDGIVKNVNENLGSPLITISSTIPVITGHFNEDERYQIEDGISVVISSKHIKKKLTGTLQSVSKLPSNSHSENAQNGSEYSFIVQMDDEVETELLNGTHVELSFITKEIDGALMVPKETIVKKKKDSFIWVITESGLLEKREIKTGLSSKGKVQIKSGAEKNELIVSEPKSIQKGEGPTFISPLNFAKLEISELKQMRKKQISKDILKGILIR